MTSPEKTGAGERERGPGERPAIARDRQLVRYTGRSMWPTMQAGDLLVVESPLTAPPRAGDCILFRDPATGAVMVHRVVRTRPAVCTRGDGQRMDDTLPLGEGDVVGLVVGRIRHTQSRRIRGGFSGRVAGRVSGFLGRLDPRRPGRLGGAARLIVAALRPLTRRRARSSRVAVFGEASGDQRAFATLGERVLAVSPSRGDAWTVVWPLALAYDPRDLPAPWADPSNHSIE